VGCAGLMACKHVAVLPVGLFLSQQDLNTLVNLKILEFSGIFQIPNFGVEYKKSFQNSSGEKKQK
jgi:hypothetical protein